MIHCGCEFCVLGSSLRTSPYIGLDKLSNSHDNKSSEEIFRENPSAYKGNS